MKAKPGVVAALLGAFAAVPSAAGCGSDGSGGSDVINLFDPSTTRLVVEVDYQTGAEPYVGNLPNGSPIWSLTRENLQRMFPDRTVTVPTQLSQMEQLTDVSGSSFTSQQLLDIAAAHDGSPDGSGTATFYLVFVDGLFNQDGADQPQVLGVHLGGTRVIGIFKPVIRSSEGPLMLVSRFVEQATLVHELGHAVGLVENGVAAQSAHHDTAHGAHCTNQQCVMYYANEGAADLAEFVRDYISSGDVVLLGSECLADLDAARSTK